jgi:hypothetical protein
MAIEPIAGSKPDDFAGYIKSETGRWEVIVRKSQIRLE